MDIGIVDCVGNGESDEIPAPSFTKETSHISSLFPLVMLSMQSGVSIQEVFPDSV